MPASIDKLLTDWLCLTRRNSLICSYRLAQLSESKFKTDWNVFRKIMVIVSVPKSIQLYPPFFNELSIFLKSINLSLRRGMGPRVLYFHPYPPSNPLWRAIRSLQTIYPGAVEQAYLKNTRLFCCRFSCPQLASLCQLIQWYSPPPFPLLLLAGRGCACVTFQDGEFWASSNDNKKAWSPLLILFYARGPSSSAGSQGPYKKSAADESLMDCVHCATLPKDIARKIYLYFFLSMYEILYMHF